MRDNKAECKINPLANKNNVVKDSICSNIVAKSCKYGEARLSSIVDDECVMESAKRNVNASELKLDKYRVVMRWVPKERAKEDDDYGRWEVYKTVTTLKPNEVCNEAHLIIASYSTRDEAYNLCAYLKTKFVIFLVACESLENKICKTSFIHVPMQDFSKPLTDTDLYAKYGLNQEEIAFIKTRIQSINEEGR